MPAVLGIDAAWTDRTGSGVALVAETPNGWRCLRAAPNVAEFLAGLSTRTGGPTALLEACARLTDHPVDVVAIDMPLARGPITCRRSADDAISKAFGHAACSTHTPNADRPGPLSDRLRTAFEAEGFHLVTARPPAKTRSQSVQDRTPATEADPRKRALLEVYPHPAILAFLNLDYRHPYKVAKARRYWPKEQPDTRRTLLRGSLAQLYTYAESRLGPLGFPPPPATARTAELKRHEDTLDALICALIGIEYLNGNCTPYGDESATIWVPNKAQPGAEILPSS